MLSEICIVILAILLPVTNWISFKRGYDINAEKPLEVVKLPKVRKKPEMTKEQQDLVALLNEVEKYE